MSHRPAKTQGEKGAKCVKSDNVRQSKIPAATLASLKEQLAKDPSFVSQLTEDETIAVRKDMTPLGNIVCPHKRWANMSITNYKEQFMKKFYMTSMIGYLFRLAQEYTPEEEIEVINKYYDEKVAKLQASRKNVNLSGENDITLRQEIQDIRAEESAKIAQVETTYRSMLYNFLSRHLEFNPDHHVRKMHNDKAKMDADKRAELITQRCSLQTKVTANDKALSSKPDRLYAYMRNNLLETYQAATQTAEYIESVMAVMENPNLSLDEKNGMLSKKYHGIVHMLADMKKIVEPISHVETYEALTRDPPADLNHHFSRYVSNHYEALREITEVCCNERADVEFSVTLYDTFKTEAAAHAHIMAHEKEFAVEPITVENQGITLLGPFKENREKANFYNQRTDLLLRMHQQNVADQRLGEDLMAKQVEKKKQKEILREGPDKEGLSKFSEVMNGARALGATKVIDKETMDKLEANRKIAEDREVPKKAIQIDIFKTEENPEGTPIMRRDVMYTAEEPPLFMEPNSQWADKYLPVGYDAAKDIKCAKNDKGKGKLMDVLTK